MRAKKKSVSCLSHFFSSLFKWGEGTLTHTSLCQHFVILRNLSSMQPKSGWTVETINCLRKFLLKYPGNSDLQYIAALEKPLQNDQFPNGVNFQKAWLEISQTSLKKTQINLKTMDPLSLKDGIRLLKYVWCIVLTTLKVNWGKKSCLLDIRSSNLYVVQQTSNDEHDTKVNLTNFVNLAKKLGFSEDHLFSPEEVISSRDVTKLYQSLYCIFRSLFIFGGF